MDVYRGGVNKDVLGGFVGTFLLLQSLFAAQDGGFDY